VSRRHDNLSVKHHREAASLAPPTPMPCSTGPKASEAVMEANGESPPPIVAGPTKGRPGCLTAWLWWLVVANAVAAAGSPLMLASIRQRSTPDFPAWVAWPFSLFSLLAAVGAFALLRWKKWGLYGYSLSAAAIFSLNVYAGVSASASAVGLAGVVILFAVLQLGGTKKRWSQLE
jgi:hypothetical protein